MKISIWTIPLLAVTIGCGKSEGSGGTEPDEPATVQTTYVASNADFPNPERGFYRYSQTLAGSPEPLNLAQLKSWRTETQANGGNYKIYSTLVFRYYELNAFRSQALSAAFLTSIAQDFSLLREAGLKMIPRFTYTVKGTPSGCPEGFICPPYGDAPKNIVLQHISQLRDVLHENADVLAAVQMGFIGVWGEQYYTDYFGDASQNGAIKKLTDANWQDRIDVLKALLAAVPKDRMVQVRYPQIKQRYVYGIQAGVTVAAMTPAEAFSGEDKARIGYHNDCFLASADDYGTYEDYGNSSSPRQSANTVLRSFSKTDSKYLAVGGETCSDDYSPQNDCEPAGRAQTEMKELHYSFLNCAYNNAVNNDWQAGGCMDAIRKNLGYRFVLKTGTIPASVAPGSSMAMNLELENQGYASPYNARPLILVLRNKTGGAERRIPLTADVRQWFTGPVSLKEQVMVPSDLAAGEYDLWLSLPDAYPSIASRPEFAIRFANENVWEDATGYNDLHLTLKIK